MNYDDQEWQRQQADEELQQMICEALDRCASAGADGEALKLLAWQAGVSYWKPNERKEHAAHK